MYTSGQLSDGRRERKGSEKSKFAQTCNLLSQYIKEKGSLRDLNLEIDGKIESLETIVKRGSSASTTLSMLIDKRKSAQLSTEQEPSMAPNSSINTIQDALCEPTRDLHGWGAEAMLVTAEKRDSSQLEASGSDLPIARRSSLHRFLEKRKDRAAARGRYQIQEQPASSSKGEEQLELKL